MDDRVGPVCVDLETALSWSRDAVEAVWINVHGHGRWHDDGPSHGFPGLPVGFPGEEVIVTPWETLRQRTWTTKTRIELGSRDFDAALRHLDRRGAVDVVTDPNITIDEELRTVGLRCRVLAPTQGLAGDIAINTLQYWVSGSLGLEDQFRTGLSAEFVDARRGDGSSELGRKP